MPVSTESSAETCLVADIGGTNARFAVAHISPCGTPTLKNFRVFPCAEYHALEEIISEYLDTNPDAKPAHACLAVAGPVVQGKVYITNLGWELDTDKVKQQFSFDDLLIINDYAALAKATEVLKGESLLTLLPGKADLNGPVSVMGPGTGFGVAIMVRCDSGNTVITSEGGHISFVPTGEREMLVWNALMNNMGRVTVESLLSGVGIMRIYRELCHLENITPLNYEPSTISNMALDHGDPICKETLEIFCSMLGSVVGDLALAQGATGGIYLGGGILPKISDFVLKSNFRQAFLDKPPMQKYVADIPVYLITAPDAALYGAAVSYCDSAAQAATTA